MADKKPKPTRPPPAAIALLRPKEGAPPATMDLTAREIAQSRFGTEPIPLIVLIDAERMPDGSPFTPGNLLYLEMTGDVEIDDDIDRFVAWLRALVAECRCREIMLIAEFWAVPVAVAEGEIADSPGRLGNLAQHPARVEKVLLRHETRREAVFHMADITDVAGVRTMGPWIRHADDEISERVPRFMPAEGTS